MPAALRAQTVALPYELVIKPISIQNSSGHVAVLTDYSSSISLFQAATQRAFAQAGVRVVWDTWGTYVDSTNSYYTITGAGTQLDGLTQVAPGVHGSSSNSTTLNVWFTGSNGGILGYSEQSLNVAGGAFQLDPVWKNGATVSESVFTSSSYYSLTTLPHEIGHVLGLKHTAINSGPTYSSTPLTSPNLMTGETVGATSFGGIWNGTTGFGVLTEDQIQMLLLNPLIHANPVAGDSYTYNAVPEPANYVLAAGVLSGLFAVWRKKRRVRS